MLKRLIKTGKYEFVAKNHQNNLKKHPLTYLFWESTLSCNFRCRHCGSDCERQKYPDDLTANEIKSTFLQISQDFDASKITIAVTGGESLLREDLFEVMNYARSLGFHWGMVTNGYLVTKSAVDKLKKAGMETVVVSIDAIGKDHDEFRNMPGAYDKALNAVELLAQADFLYDLQITTTVYPGNLDQLDQMYERFKDTGITSWRVMNVDPIGRAKENNLTLDHKQLKRLLDFIKAKRKSSKIKITFGCSHFLGFDYDDEVRDRPFTCLTGINVASILHNGDIFVCPNVPRLTELIQGNVKNDRFKEIWENKFKIFRNRKEIVAQKCLDCESWDYCQGDAFHVFDLKNKKPGFCYQEFKKSS